MSFDKLRSRWLAKRRERKKRCSQVRKNIKTECQGVFERYGIKKAVLFGSVLENRYSDNSDVDLLVFSLQTHDYWSCWLELEQTLRCPVDLHTNDEPAGFVNKIINRGEVLYEL